jgi:enoyl-CoA hydratase/carnithine racemase
VVPEFGSSWSIPARIGHIRAAELILLGLPFDAERAAELGFVTQVVPDPNLMTIATEVARKLAAKQNRNQPPAAMAPLVDCSSLRRAAVGFIR